MACQLFRSVFNSDLWFLTLQNRVRKNTDRHTVISDVRFPNEIEFIKKQGGLLVRVDRGAPPAWFETALLANKGNSIAKNIMTKTYPSAHLSEWAWVGTDVDYVFSNNGSLDELNGQIQDYFGRKFEYFG